MGKARLLSGSVCSGCSGMFRVLQVLLQHSPKPYQQQLPH